MALKPNPYQHRPVDDEESDYKGLFRLEDFELDWKVMTRKEKAMYLLGGGSGMLAVFIVWGAHIFFSMIF